MSNKSIIDEAIEQMQQKMIKSREICQRNGDYRIGLYAAINILENLREMHKEEMIEFAHINSVSYRHEISQKFNETYGGNK